MKEFHEVLLQDELDCVLTGTPEYSTQVLVMASGHESRNARWQLPRRRYQWNPSAFSLQDLARLNQFFLARKGRLHGFRLRDAIENEVSTPEPLMRLDQSGKVWGLTRPLGTGDDASTQRVHKPVEDGFVLTRARKVVAPSTYTLDATRGTVTLAHADAGAELRANFRYHIPVRFDMDALDIQMTGANAGRAAPITMVELRLADEVPS